MNRTLLARTQQFLDQRVLLLGRSKRDSLIITFPGTLEGEERSFKSGRAVWRRWSFAFRIRQVIRASVLLAPALCREGLSLVYCKRWLAEAAFERLHQNKREAVKPGRSLQAMVRGGYLLCGYCGRPMYVWTPKYPAPPRYHCRWVLDQQDGQEFHGVQACPGKKFAVRHEPLDQAVWQDIVNYFSDPNWLERVLAQERQRASEQTASKTERLNELNQALEGKETASEHLVKLATKINSDTMREKLQKQLNELGDEIEALEQERASLLGLTGI